VISREASPSSPPPARAVRLIGVDWSTVEPNRGVAVVDYAEGATSLIALSACTSRQTALRLIADAISTSSSPSVVAIDAPLGWPVGLAVGLGDHSAGEGLEVGADEMFSRETDRFVQRTLNKRPLEVGANLIARTAHSANQFLCDVRKATARAIPLLWSPEELSGAGAIEVYPAATKIVVTPQSAAEVLGFNHSQLRYANAHVEDALWCAVAALHFVRGECDPPIDLARSRQEGWIWFRRRGGS
jgi:predicted nuclease with RNAse H fold